MSAPVNNPYESICLSDDLSTFDPYDIWKTGIGLKVKDTFNKNRILGAGPALALTVADQLVNNKLRLGYSKQEYPIVRALAAQILLHTHERTKEKRFLVKAEQHLEWLRENISTGYSGACWGIGFKWPAASNVIYDANTPLATHTPYALEALHLYTKVSGDDKFINLIKSCFQFFEKDLFTMYEDDTMMATSYGPFKDRIVTNAISYVMYSYAILLLYYPDKEKYIVNKIHKLYTFICRKQRPDGSWLYAPDDENSFIDCFHSCFIIKNIIKTEAILKLNKSNEITANAYRYLCEHFYDVKSGLYKRFSLSNKLSLVKFDLYDNSEMLSLMNLMGDLSRLNNLDTAIKRNFTKGNDIYSLIDLLGIKRNKNTLRWAVMPYLYALSTLE